MANTPVRQGALAVADQAVVSAGNFLATVLPAKVLGGDEFGQYVVAITTIFLLSGIIGALTHAPLRIQAVAAAGAETRGYVADQLVILALLSAPVALLAALVLRALFGLEADAAIAAAAALFLAQVHEFSRAARGAAFAWKALALADVIAHGTRLAALAVLGAAQVLSCAAALWCLALGAALAVGATRFAAVPLAPQAAGLRRSFQRSWAFGKWLLMESLLYSASTQVYVLVIGAYLNAATAGVLGALQQIVNVVNVAQIGLIQFVTPHARQRLLDGDTRGWAMWLVRTAAILVAVTAVLMGVICLYGETILAWLYRPAFAAYSRVLWILAAAAILTGCNAVWSTAFRTADRPEAGLFAKAAAAAATVLIGLPLVRYAGIAGAACGLVMTQAIWFGVYAYLGVGRRQLSAAGVSVSLRP